MNKPIRSKISSRTIDFLGKRNDARLRLSEIERVGNGIPRPTIPSAAALAPARRRLVSALTMQENGSETNYEKNEAVENSFPNRFG